MKTSEKELNARIKRAYEAATPDVLDSVLSCCQKEKGRVIPVEKKIKNKKARFIAWAAAAAAMLLVLGGTIGVLAQSANERSKVVTTVSIDVNPSIEIKVDNSEKVVSVNALNDDAAKVLGGMDFKGSSIEVAVNAIIGSMLRNGYLNEIANSILLTVDNADARKAEELQRRLSSEIEAALSRSGGGAVISQTADTRDDMEQIAQMYGITKGKAQLIYSIIAAEPRYTFEQLAGLTINELNLLYIRNNRVSDGNNRISEGRPSENAYIGRDRAVEIALAYANITEKDVDSNIECGLDFEHGRMIYDVEFRAKGYEYDIDVDAINGSVVGFSIEPINIIPLPDPSGAPAPAPTTAPAYIGEQSAKSIAFERAGVNEADVTGLSIKLEYDHGRMVYDVEFRSAGYEYDVDVDAITGGVVSFEKESIGSNPNPTNVPNPNPNPTNAPNPNPNLSPAPTTAPGYIGEEAAKRIAFQRAGISASEATHVRVQLKRDDGRMIYDVEFRARGYEYDVEVDAITGAVLEYDVDWDDNYYPITTQAPSPTTAPAPAPTSAPTYIGVENAKRIAFQRAGVNASDAYNVKVELERENGRMIYEVEFDAGVYEYDVKIDAVSGSVLYYNREYDDDAHPTNPPAPSNPSPTTPPQQPSNPNPTNPPAGSSLIGEARAKAIAFQRAGVSAGQVSALHIELDYDDGIRVYEVEFRANGFEYTVEINAVSGAVLDYECDTD